jgi:alpha-glucosidase
MNTGGESTFEKDNYLETGMPAEAGELFPGTVISYGEYEGRWIFYCDNRCALEISCLECGPIRFRFAPHGDFEDDFSYAVLPEALTLRKPAVSEEDEEFTIRADGLVVFLLKNGLRMRIEDDEGRVLSRDEKGFHWYDNQVFGGEVVMTSRVIQPSEHFYGLGDIPGHKNLRGQRRQLWGSDVYGYTEETDPLYKNIPFFIGVHHSQAYGIFFDNTFRSQFDFGHERSSVSSFWAQGGTMNYYFIKGPSVPEVVAGYSRLTGRPELPPLWALGFHQCKWSYKSEAEVLSIADGFTSRKIPCDAIYVDIDYMDGFRCFTWNRNEANYPHPARLSARLAEDGIKLMVIIDPGIKVDPEYEIYQSGKESGVFCKRMDGPPMTGNVWPGPCHFPDFTDPKARDWWAGLFPPFMQESGVAGIWTDMNEPAVFNEDKTFPRDVRHDFDGHPCSHRKAHNVYGMQMSRATREGIRRALPDKRPFVITRSAYAGTQRYSSAWTGDIESTWDHLRIGNIQCQRLSLSGYSFVGTDIGGFSGRSHGELFVRWLQMGIFHPFCRVHSSGDQNEQEPWSFGEPYTSVAKKFIELRYRILPYLYTLFEDHTRTGAPMLRSLIYLDETDLECHNRAEEFALGPSLFTCPISKPGVEGRWLYPPGGLWYDFWTDEQILGAEERWVDVPLESTPLFVRGGTILPLSPVRANSSAPIDFMELHLYPDEGEAVGFLYEDAGDGYEESLNKRFQLKDGKLSQERKGDFKPAYREYRITTHGGNWSFVSIDGGEAVPISSGQAFSVPECFTSLVLST